jgi:hypothetical protein
LMDERQGRMVIDADTANDIVRIVREWNEDSDGALDAVDAMIEIVEILDAVGFNVGQAL